MRLLLIEDEWILADSLSTVLKKENYIVDVCYNGESGLNAALSNIYDVIILDLMLPKLNGFDVLKQLRTSRIATPVIILTAKFSLTDKVTGLDVGADDYLTKPFLIEELLARLRALCRRQADLSEDIYHFSDLELHPSKCIITCSLTHKSVQLGQKEAQLMEYLFFNKDSIVTKEQLLLKIWGYNNNAEYNNVEVYVSFTRKKIAFVGSKAKIKSIRGMGYRLEED